MTTDKAMPAGQALDVLTQYSAQEGHPKDFEDAISALSALALTSQAGGDAVAWMLKTGHGTKIVESKPDCLVDMWRPLYSARPVPTATQPEPAPQGEERKLLINLMEWRWVDDKGRAMTEWKRGNPPPMLDVADSKGEMHVEARIAPDTEHAGVVDIDEIALESAREIALMWGHDRSHFISKIQVRVRKAMLTSAPREVVADRMQRLVEYADESDSACYGTLSTTLVRDLANEALAALRPTNDGDQHPPTTPPCAEKETT